MKKTILIAACAAAILLLAGCDRRGDVMDGSDMFLDISEESPASSVDSVSVVTESAVSESVVPEASGGETGQVLYFNTTDLDDNPVSLEPYVGSRSYEDWEQIVLEQLAAVNGE